MHAPLTDWECLFASTYGGKCLKTMEIWCDWHWASGMPREKTKEPGEEPGQKCPPQPAQGSRGVMARWLSSQTWRLCTCGTAGINWGICSYKKGLAIFLCVFNLLHFTGMLHLSIKGNFIQYSHLRGIKIINQTLLEKKVVWKRGGWM